MFFPTLPARVAKTLTAANADDARNLLAWPHIVRGYGPVRAANTQTARANAAGLRERYDAKQTPDPLRVAAE